MMHEFNTDEFFWANGKKCFPVLKHNNFKTKEVKGCDVKINGIIYKCVAIERFALQLGNPFVGIDEPISLMVEPKQVQSFE